MLTITVIIEGGCYSNVRTGMSSLLSKEPSICTAVSSQFHRGASKAMNCQFSSVGEAGRPDLPQVSKDGGERFLSCVERPTCFPFEIAWCPEDSSLFSSESYLCNGWIPSFPPSWVSLACVVSLSCCCTAQQQNQKQSEINHI